MCLNVYRARDVILNGKLGKRCLSQQACDYAGVCADVSITVQRKSMCALHPIRAGSSTLDALPSDAATV